MKILLLCCVLFLASLRPAFAYDLTVPLVRAIEQGNWHIALAESKSSSPLKSYVQWRSLQDSSEEVSFSQLRQFMDSHPDWPNLNRLQLRAEKELFQANDRSPEAANWLQRYQPISGYGKLAWVRLHGTDHNKVRNAWIHGDFERQDETRILGEFRASLDPATHQRRAEHLLQEGKASIAERLLDFVPDAHARLYRARIALQRNENGLSAKIDRVPASLKNDHGLLADRLIWRHKRGLASGARELLLKMGADSPYANALWRIRASYVRDAIEAKHYKDAAALLNNAGNQLTGAAQADALWLKGWLELTFMNQPRAAYETFYKLFHAVSYPISKARGAYWASRAADENGNQTIAQEWLKRAAEYPTAFYGQLAHAALYGTKPLTLPAMPKADSATHRKYESHPLMKLVVAFHQAGMAPLAMPLVHHLAEQQTQPGEFAALAQLMAEAGMLHAQVRVVKEAQKHNIILPEGWPSAQIPSGMPLPPELAFAISRQESEFNPVAVSSANARGLMQLLPSTGRKVASKIGMPYSLERLFDPEFNMRLGSQYLYDLIAGFDNNVILAIAGYNAGPGRSRQWVERFGWPGKDFDQTLTFLELIPFSETRNYVQRVLENQQMYRRLANSSAPMTLKQELLR